MTDFFPFIHEPKRKELEPEPLYVELHIPPPEYKKPIEEEVYERGVIIIQL